MSRECQSAQQGAILHHIPAWLSLLRKDPEYPQQTLQTFRQHLHHIRLANPRS